MDMFGNNLYQNTAPYASMYDPNYIQKLEQENKMLKEKQQQMADPMYAQYYNSPEVENDKMNNFMTYLFALCAAEWEKTDLGQAFIKKHSPNSDEYKKFRDARLKTETPTVTPNIVPNVTQNSTPIGSFANPNNYNPNGMN